MKSKSPYKKLQQISHPRHNLHIKTSDISLTGKIKTSPYIQFNNHKKNTIDVNKKNSCFIQYKQKFLLPNFQSKPSKLTLDVKRHHTLQSAPRPYKIKHHGNYRSKSIATTNLKDNVYQCLMKKQLRSIDIGDLSNNSCINKLDTTKYLTPFQKGEIVNYKDIYYIGHKAFLRKSNGNFRDSKDNYKALIGDHIAYRFEITKILGQGAFGKVLQVYDHKTFKLYALKITKYSTQLFNQFLLQIQILKFAKQCTSQNKNIVDIKGDFQFRGHLCIVTEMLSSNLYHFLKARNYEGLHLDIVRKIIIQIIQSLMFLHKKNICHCDIKPQNVCFKQLGKTGVKLIDFGSACYLNNKQFTYIQSRYYRAPEIVLVKPYDHKIDMWSLGCMIYQLLTGMPLFPSRSEDQQMNMITAVLGSPSVQFLGKCQRGSQFVFQEPQNIYTLKQRLTPYKNGSLIDFVQKLVRWTPEQRMEAKQALLHDFVLEGLPTNVRIEHLKQMNSSSPYGLF